MKLHALLFLSFLALLNSCTKESTTARPAGVPEPSNPNPAVEDRGCGTATIQLQIAYVNPSGYKPYLIVYDEDGSTRYVYPWACSNQGCTSSPCLDAADNNFYQSFTVDKCERIKVQLFEVDANAYDCNNGTGNVTVRIKKPGQFGFQSTTLTYSGGSNWPSKCFDIDSNGNVSAPYTCP